MKWKKTDIVQQNGAKALLLLPEWDSFNHAGVLADLRSILDEGRMWAEKVSAEPAHTFETLVLSGESIDRRIHEAWGPADHMNTVMQTDELREVIKKGREMLTEYSSDIGCHEGVYSAFLAYAKTPSYQSLPKEEKYIVDKTILDMKRNGAGLSKDKKLELKKINLELSKTEEDFSTHLIDAIDTWTKLVDNKDELSGIPEEVIESMANIAKEKGKAGYLITLLQPTVFAVFEHANHRDLRKEVFLAYNARVSEFSSNPKLDNAPLIDRILELRDQKAKLLGFSHFVDLSLDSKTAESFIQVRTFLDRLAEKSFPKAKEEYADLQLFAKEKFGIDTLFPWDIAYVSEKLRLEKYSVSDEELRPYFPESKVFTGLFGLLHNLYGVEISEDNTAPVWKTGVKFFRVLDHSGALIGCFYADLYSREKKRSGAWMDECVSRSETEEVVTIPVAYLNCNFTQPSEGEEGYLTHSEVETVFHETGHVFHLLLSKCKFLSSGMMHVEWDAVECPSQLLEQWCWEKSILKGISQHKETNEPMQDELCDRLISAKYFHSALFFVRQIEFALVDLLLHAQDSTSKKSPREILSQVRSLVRVTPVYEDDRFLNGFQHIFGGGYSAGYFSYKWAEVLSADVFEAFVESGDVCSREIGEKFRAEVLAPGSSRPFMEGFVKFRGRNPSEDALLRLCGLAHNQNK